MTDQICSAAVEHRRQQKRSGGGGNDEDYKNEGNGGGSLAAAHAVVEAEARQRWQRRLDHPLHNLTPLPAQAGEDAAGVHPTPATTTALFGSGFLANLVQQPQAVDLPPVLHHRVIGLDPPLVEPLNAPY